MPGSPEACGDGRDWVAERFAARCYFYPARDCPGWTAGQLCSRMEQRIPGIPQPEGVKYAGQS